MPETVVFPSNPFDTIAFDADDTLWHNEDAFNSTERAFEELMLPWVDVETSRQHLIEVEQANLRLFGYGVKSFMLSMIEAATTLSKGRVSSDVIGNILERGKAMLDRPPELLDGVAETLDALASTHRLVLITKGDLHHQERKVFESSLAEHFDGIEVVAEKDVATYRRITQRYGLDPSRVVMVGNSVKSDIMPMVELGGTGVHIPYAFTWAHEVVPEDQLAHLERNTDGARYWELASITDLPALLARLGSTR